MTRAFGLSKFRTFGKTSPGGILANGHPQNGASVLGLRKLACYNEGETERIFRGMEMVVASGMGEAVELQRAAWNEWTEAMARFDREGPRGHKRFAILVLRLGYDVPSRVIASAFGLSEGHVRRLIRQERERLKKNSYRAKKASALAR